MAMLLGARVIDHNGNLDEDFSDPRIKAGVLLSAGGRGGEALSPFAAEHFPHLNQDYSQMTTRTLVVSAVGTNLRLPSLGQNGSLMHISCWLPGLIVC